MSRKRAMLRVNKEAPALKPVVEEKVIKKQPKKSVDQKSAEVLEPAAKEEE